MPAAVAARPMTSSPKTFQGERGSSLIVAGIEAPRPIRRMNLPYPPGILHQVCRDPKSFPNYLADATFPGAITCLAFALHHLVYARWKEERSDHLFERYRDFARMWDVPATSPGHFGKALRTWYRLVTGLPFPDPPLRRLEGERKHVYQNVAFVPAPLDVNDPRYSGKALLSFDVHPVPCSCPECWPLYLAKPRKRTRPSAARRCSPDYLRQVQKSPQHYRGYLDGEPEAPAAALAFVLQRLAVEPHAYVRVEEVYRAYCDFCESNGHPVLSRKDLGHEIAEFLKSKRLPLEKSRRRYWGNREYTYEGLALRAKA